MPVLEMPTMAKQAEEKAKELWEKTYGKKKEEEENKESSSQEGDDKLDESGEEETEDLDTEEENTDEEDDSQQPEKEDESDEGTKSEDLSPPTEETDDEESELRKDYKKLEQKYSTLQGKYNSEISSLTQTVKSLELMIGNLSTQKEEDNQAELEAEKKEKLSKAKDTLKEQAGEDLAPAIQTILDSYLAENLAPILEQVKAVKKDSAKTKETIFEEKLKGLVPDYEAIGANPDFKIFLGGEAPFVGTTYQELLNHAYSTFNAKSTAQIFNAYKKEKGIYSEDKKKEAQSKTKAKTESFKEKAKKAAAPRRKTKSASANTDSQKRIYTPEEITQFFKDKATGQLKLDNKKAEEIQKDMIRAANEGRVKKN